MNYMYFSRKLEVERVGLMTRNQQLSILALPKKS